MKGRDKVLISDNVIIRGIKEEDIEHAVRIRIDGWKNAYRGIIDDDFLDSMNGEKQIERWKKDYKEGGFIVATLSNEVIGFARYECSNKFAGDTYGADCQMLAIYVKPDLKYSGIGTKLFNYVTCEFKRKNKSKMILWCLKANEPSKQFYTKIGGRVIKEILSDIGGKNYPEVCFEFDI